MSAKINTVINLVLGNYVTAQSQMCSSFLRYCFTKNVGILIPSFVGRQRLEF